MLALLVTAASSFAPRSTILHTPALRRSSTPSASGALIALDAIEPAFSAYAGIWVPLFATLELPQPLIHWGHAAAMTTVLSTMGLYGTYLGWQIRLGSGEDVLPLNLGKPNREMHQLLMGGALFFFLLGGQGGFVLLALQGQPLLQSAHSSTAVIGLSLLIAQATLGKLMGGSSLGRSVHAYLGSGTMLALFFHAFYGLQLGLSF